MNFRSDARARLPEGALARLTRSSGRKLEKHGPRDWHWHGTRVRLADGTTAGIPDTGANQRDDCREVGHPQEASLHRQKAACYRQGTGDPLTSEQQLQMWEWDKRWREIAGF